MTIIRRLPETLVNQIAAGEVLERPAAAVKELVENAIDAGARRIDVVLRDGGRSLIAVTDDGKGMSPEDLALAVERHATSKLPDDNLDHINTLGFRGEALPSIGAVSRLTITSRAANAAEAWAISVNGGAVGPIIPAAHPPGTRVEVRDLFYATPARLKFLKIARTEYGHVEDALERLAMAHPHIAFSLTEDGRAPWRVSVQGGLLEMEASAARLSAVNLFRPRIVAAETDVLAADCAAFDPQRRPGQPGQEGAVVADRDEGAVIALQPAFQHSIAARSR